MMVIVACHFRYRKHDLPVLIYRAAKVLGVPDSSIPVERVSNRMELFKG